MGSEFDQQYTDTDFADEGFDDEPWIEGDDYTPSLTARGELPTSEELALMHEENLGIHIPMAEDAFEEINAKLGDLYDQAEEAGNEYVMQVITEVHQRSTQLVESVHQLSATGAGLAEIAKTYQKQRTELAEALSRLRSELEDAYYSEDPEVLAAVEQITEGLFDDDELGDYYYNEYFDTAVQTLRNWGCEENVQRFAMMILGSGLGSPNQNFKNSLKELLKTF